MEAATSVPQTLPPQAVVMQMALGAWGSKVISDVIRLNIPDLIKQHGSMSAADLVSDRGVDARLESLERALPACASLGVLTEDAAGKFGPTELSDGLTIDS